MRFGLSAPRAPAQNPVRPVVTNSSKKPMAATKAASSSAGSICEVKTTPALQNLLDSWGQELVNKVMECYDAWRAGCRDAGASSWGVPSAFMMTSVSCFLLLLTACLLVRCLLHCIV